MVRGGASPGRLTEVFADSVVKVRPIGVTKKPVPDETPNGHTAPPGILCVRSICVLSLHRLL